MPEQRDEAYELVVAQQQSDNESLRAQLAAANAEVQEQARLNGMGAEREAKLRAQLEEEHRQLLATQAHAARMAGVLTNFKLVEPDDDGDVWLVLNGNGTSGKGAFNLGKAERIGVQVALRLEEDRSKALSTPINLDALHEAMACECERLANMMASTEPATVVQLAGAIVALRREAADHRAKKEGK